MAQLANHQHPSVLNVQLATRGKLSQVHQLRQLHVHRRKSLFQFLVVFLFLSTRCINLPCRRVLCGLYKSLVLPLVQLQMLHQNLDQFGVGVQPLLFETHKVTHCPVSLQHFCMQLSKLLLHLQHAGGLCLPPSNLHLPHSADRHLYL